ncbi:hypothetical protein FHR83_004540 [Actinoplanes campanulatus]|uniref:Uncharacterized protein n=1 Tax=Actinoplanes campanulatus TaxID=113559 RepID=A0A7W5FFU8_9ACTN|nr:hypothetical protein [Actinoplanes campanulatus]MBB3096866.1 hypothetical protein [Actinoplanes campanulatus]GGN44609.1 hypothetical protein GCM10010109_77990 [Actinoplanes campanulatus]GID37410.1 hypothetical protein Aca09nite_39160 [Actinoplanes campanulatus]
MPRPAEPDAPSTRGFFDRLIGVLLGFIGFLLGANLVHRLFAILARLRPAPSLCAYSASIATIERGPRKEVLRN